jgi:hypothetical protein
MNKTVVSLLFVVLTLVRSALSGPDRQTYGESQPQQKLQQPILIPEDADKRVLVPTSDIGTRWRRNIDFDDSDWMVCSGPPGGIGYEKGTGYEDLITLDVGDRMHESGQNPNSSCYIRIIFNVGEDDLEQIGRLMLKIRYDDGYVAYLNNRSIAQANAPDRPAWNSTATNTHEAQSPDSFRLLDWQELIDVGDNLLAIHALNADISSSDFLITVSLEAEEDPLKDFTSSNLPLVFINTDGQSIPDGFRITAEMGIIDNGIGNRNAVNDPLNNYNGQISVEIRGSSSAGWRKKQYNVETQDEQGNNLNVELMGLPPENDWILNAPYIDKSMLRNVLTYHLARKMGRYASRTRYCELFLNGDYQGVYILMEKVKRDGNRVNIAALDSTAISGDALTGGYIIKVDKPGNDGFTSEYPPWNGTSRRIFYQYHYPSDDEILPQQKNYIEKFIDEFEGVMDGLDYADPVSGYPKYIDMDSFIDFYIIAEISKNVDAYRLSQFFYKDRDTDGGKLHAGPPWDYNLSYGLADYYDGEDTDDWMLEELAEGEDIKGDGSQVPFFWIKLFRDPTLSRQLKKRWEWLRSDVLDIQQIHAFIDAVADTLDEAQQRNFIIWTAPGEPKAAGDGFWPVPAVFYEFESYQDEIDFLKDWIEERIQWIDENILLLTEIDDPEPKSRDFELYQNSPNPFNASTQIRFDIPADAFVTIVIFNVRGQRIRTLTAGHLRGGTHFSSWDGRNDHGVAVASGVYFCRLAAKTGERTIQFSKKMLLLP